jgi:type II secretory pathway component PulF
MALYYYKALSKDGKKISGTLDAASLANVRETLVKRGLYPISITASQEGTNFSKFFRDFFQKNVDSKDLIFFTKQLSVLLKAGVPLLQALELLIEQTEGQLSTIVIHLKDDIKEGKSLAEGLGQYPKIFSNTYIQLVKAGEASGKLETILDRLTSYIERSDVLRKKIRGAFTMPAIQLSIALGVVVLLMVVVVPGITETFSSMKMELPLTTKILMWLSDFLLNYYLIVLGILVTSIGGFIWWKKTESGSRVWDKFILKVPIAGYFARMGAVVQFSSTLGMLMEGGVNLAEALTIVTSIVKNKILVDKLQQARDSIIKQGKIAQYLKETEMFPAVAIYLIKTGEESGTLPDMLLQVGNYYDAEVTEYADGLVSKITPAMTMFMGAIVGFVVMAIASPMLQMNESLGKDL